MAKSRKSRKQKVDAYEIQVLKGKTWSTRATITHVNRADGSSRLIKDENDALRYGYGVFGTRPRKGQATSKSGKKFRAVKVQISA